MDFLENVHTFLSYTIFVKTYIYIYIYIILYKLLYNIVIWSGQSTDEVKLKSQTTPGLLGSSQGSTTTLCVIDGKNSQRGVYSNVEPNGIRPRKPCNCTKSQCLKL